MKSRIKVGTDIKSEPLLGKKQLKDIIAKELPLFLSEFVVVLMGFATGLFVGMSMF